MARKIKRHKKRIVRTSSPNPEAMKDRERRRVLRSKGIVIPTVKPRVAGMGSPPGPIRPLNILPKERDLLSKLPHRSLTPSHEEMDRISRGAPVVLKGIGRGIVAAGRYGFETYRRRRQKPVPTPEPEPVEEPFDQTAYKKRLRGGRPSEQELAAMDQAELEERRDREKAKARLETHRGGG